MQESNLSTTFFPQASMDRAYDWIWFGNANGKVSSSTIYRLTRSWNRICLCSSGTFFVVGVIPRALAAPIPWGRVGAFAGVGLGLGTTDSTTMGSHGPGRPVSVNCGLVEENNWIEFYCMVRHLWRWWPEVCTLGQGGGGIIIFH